MMIDITSVLRQDEKAVLSLRGLYEKYGYKKYKMSKFEQYDLYLENKNFLSGDRIVTFPDRKGRLLALKPDITLSIVKNAPRDIKGAYKAYYCENVYRAGVTSDDDDIKEIMQVGIELIGDIDLYSEGEVLTLAARSLKGISENSVIGVSHMGLISAVLEDACVSGDAAVNARKAFADRNIPLLRQICGDKSDTPVALASLYGPIGIALPQLAQICTSDGCRHAIEELEGITRVIDSMGEADAFVLDFSVSNDMNYYNGITFQGFIDGIPRSVLSGGRYDAVVRKMGLDAGAIGFAVYPDMLERFSQSERGADVDVLLVYKKEDDPAEVAAFVERVKSRGKKVCAVLEDSSCQPTYKELVRLR